jgi:hypothetical protein
MDHFDRSVFGQLTDKVDGTFISIYMPTTKAGQDTRQNSIRLRNLLRAAENACMQSGGRRSEVNRMLAPAWALLDNSEFWQHLEAGLALFAGRDFFRVFRLPIAFRELVVAAGRLHVKPLLEMFTRESNFYVLALSLHRVRLLACSEHSVTEVAIPGVPGVFEDFMQFVEEQKQIQFHTGTPPWPGGRPAMFHASGSESDSAHKKNVQDYLRLIEQSADRVLANRHWPLVLAGADFIRASFREMSRYRNIAEEGIAGNVDRLSDNELRDRAWQIARPHLARIERDAIRAFRSGNGAAMAANELPEIVRAAHAGQVGILFVSLADERWGRYDSRTGQIIRHDQRQPGDVDLLDLAAAQTLLHHGRVFGLPGLSGRADEFGERDVLGARPIAAVFRTPAVYTTAQSAE